ncbi:hypothetical protein HPB52_001636 [Rhipicephalus sanguineus]|uniref:Uncharacterized protein n=1 Tax=Rhipicephalus sanguineus TaxID=34632 RepID=A0A9D4PS49_RHISA|nr:hypothetical protein HPB52_001636 [Rhipicephalus sanguineus]
MYGPNYCRTGKPLRCRKPKKLDATWRRSTKPTRRSEKMSGYSARTPVTAAAFSAPQRLKMAGRLLRWSRMSLNMAAASPPARVAGSKMAPRARRRCHNAAFAASKYNSLRPSLKSAPVFVAAS